MYVCMSFSPAGRTRKLSWLAGVLPYMPIVPPELSAVWARTPPCCGSLFPCTLLKNMNPCPWELPNQGWLCVERKNHFKIDQLQSIVRSE